MFLSVTHMTAYLPIALTDVKSADKSTYSPVHVLEMLAESQTLSARIKG
jgi:hypothetical protein